MNRQKYQFSLRVSVGFCFLVSSLFAAPIHSSSFVSPFGSFDSSGKRRAVGWRTFGATKIKMGAVALTTTQPNEIGSIWAAKPAKVDDEFSVETKFRLSGTKRDKGGESLTWYFVGDNVIINDSDFFGGPRRFQGIAIVVSINHEESDGNPVTDKQKISVYANNGGSEPTELANCFKQLYYDEDRDDFVPSHSSSMRITYQNSRLVVDIDPRSTQRWFRCFTTIKIESIIPDTSNVWKEKMMVGIVGDSGNKRTRFEVMTSKLYDTMKDAAELASPDWNGAEGDRALQIAHQLEHNLFEIKETIESMLDQLGQKALRDIERIGELETKLENSAFMLMESRIKEVEKRLTSLSAPMVDARVRQVELRANHKLQEFKSETNTGLWSWMKPFVVIIGLLFLFAYYSHRQYSAMNKWNKNLMSKYG